MNFNIIKSHYKNNEQAIFNAGKNEWGIDPYEWNEFYKLTPIENALWADIRSVDCVLYPQYPVGKYFVDFGNPVAKVAIECDGKAFHQNYEKDRKREMDMSLLGWHIYRISGSDCKKDFDEETMESSIPYKFITEIAITHGIKRIP